jgi:hypothetical protein
MKSISAGDIDEAPVLPGVVVDPRISEFFRGRPGNRPDDDVHPLAKPSPRPPPRAAFFEETNTRAVSFWNPARSRTRPWQDDLTARLAPTRPAASKMGAGCRPSFSDSKNPKKA